MKLQHYDDQYNWNGFEFPLATQIIDNPGISVNVLFNSKNGTYASQVLKNIVASKSTYSGQGKQALRCTKKLVKTV